ncbi:MAG: pyridoxal phosphate-dependent aminotransferase family protein, partial [Deltaproteobacteria bacterium]|nr:pyridoxal phosphate-dependent aminotransferase family protein [Deltaproteobacteria bacterium]
MESLEVDSASSAENFSLQHFIRSSGDTLLDRVKPFSDYLRETTGRGYALYAREIVGPTGPRVQVKDTITGTTRSMIMMGSNNYLGLAGHPKVKEASKAAIDRCGVGMGGPPLLNGNSSLHRELELKLAALKGKEDALMFASGFQANLGWVTSLLRANDVLLCDELHHASLFDGLRLARATSRIQPRLFRHNDADHLEALLKVSRAKLAADAQIFVAVEGVYSMDGDLSPLRDI